MKKILKEKVLSSKNFIFDMDGTLIDAENLHFETFSKTLDNFFGINLTLENYKNFFAGTEIDHSFPKFLKVNGIENFDFKKLLNFVRVYKKQKLDEDFEKFVKLKSFAKEFLEILKKSGRKVCLATSASKNFAENMIEKFGIFKFFDDFVFAEDTEKSKPDPEIFLTALNKLGGKGSESIIFEDSKNGIQAGRNSKITTVAIYTKGLNDEFIKNADFVIENYKMLIDFF